jgi:hypothetical protein
MGSKKKSSRKTVKNLIAEIQKIQKGPSADLSEI